MALELINTTLYNNANLLSYYRLEGNATDSKGTNNGTASGATWGTTYGLFGQGLNSVGGSNTTIALPVGGYPSGTNITASIIKWVNFQSFVDFVDLFTWGSAATSQAFILGMGQGANNNRFHVGLYGAAGTDSSLALGTGSWYMVSVNILGGTATYYLNGSAAGSMTYGTYNIVLGSAAIAKQYDAAPTTFADDVAFFTGTLSSTEMSNHYLGLDGISGGAAMTPRSKYWGA